MGNHKLDDGGLLNQRIKHIKSKFDKGPIIMTNKEKLDKFLEELSELSNKYGLTIGGCGCCGSPWIDETDCNKIADYLEFKNNKYEASYNIK